MHGCHKKCLILSALPLAGTTLIGKFPREQAVSLRTPTWHERWWSREKQVKEENSLCYWYLSDLPPGRIWLKVILEWGPRTNRVLWATVPKNLISLASPFLQPPQAPAYKTHPCKASIGWGDAPPWNKEIQINNPHLMQTLGRPVLQGFYQLPNKPMYDRRSFYLGETGRGMQELTLLGSRHQKNTYSTWNAQ